MKSTDIKELQKWLKNLLQQEYVDSSDIRQILADFDFEAQQQVKVEPEVIVNFAEVNKIIDEMITQHKEGSARHKEYSIIYNRHKDKIDVLERLKSKINKSKISE